MKRYLFPYEPPVVVQEVLRGLRAAHMITVTNYAVVTTEDEHVAALLDKLETADEILSIGSSVYMPDTHDPKPPRKAIKVTKKARRAENLLNATATEENPAKTMDRRKYHHVGGEKVECPKCHNRVASMFMLKDRSMCKVCNQKAKRATREKSHPDTWTNQKPDFGHQEAISQIRDKSKENINLASLSGTRLG